MVRRMADNDYLLRQILNELKEQNKLLKTLTESVDNVESAVWGTAPQ